MYPAICRGESFKQQSSLTFILGTQQYGAKTA